MALLGILAMMVTLPLKGFCEVPHKISYQGYLADDLGNPLDGDYSSNVGDATRIYYNGDVAH